MGCRPRLVFVGAPSPSSSRGRLPPRLDRQRCTKGVWQQQAVHKKSCGMLNTSLDPARHVAKHNSASAHQPSHHACCVSQPRRRSSSPPWPYLPCIACHGARGRRALCVSASLIAARRAAAHGACCGVRCHCRIAHCHGHCATQGCLALFEALDLRGARTHRGVCWLGWSGLFVLPCLSTHTTALDQQGCRRISLLGTRDTTKTITAQPLLRRVRELMQGWLAGNRPPPTSHMCVCCAERYSS